MSRFFPVPIKGQKVTVNFAQESLLNHCAKYLEQTNKMQAVNESPATAKGIEILGALNKELREIIYEAGLQATKDTQVKPSVDHGSPEVYPSRGPALK